MGLSKHSFPPIKAHVYKRVYSLMRGDIVKTN